MAGSRARRAAFATASVLTLVGWSFACGNARRGDVATTPASASASVTPSASVSATIASASVAASASGAPDPIALVPWPSLVAAEAWEPAGRALDALAASEKGAEQGALHVKLARLRVAVGRCTRAEGERGEALATALAKEPDAAKLGEVIQRLRVDALLCAERWKDALAIVGPGGLAERKGALAAWARAKALEGAGELAGARAALGEAIEGGARVGLPVGTLVVTRLRVLRALAKESSKELLAAIEADRRKLFVEHPLAFDAAVRNGEPNAAPDLDGKAWLARADALANLGKGEEALHAVSAAAAAGTPARTIARAKGHVLWKARSYAKAKVALEEAIALPHTKAQDDEVEEDRFLAARATSRSGDDALAIVAYEALAKAHPGSKWGAESAYLAGHLRWLSGKWKESIAAFDRYLAGPWAKHPGQAANVREAKRARAIALLEAGSSHEAQKTFHALAGSETYATDAFARARLELLEAIAAERAGDKAFAIAAYERLERTHGYSWLELAARARLAKLGRSLDAWPLGPVLASSPPALAPEARLLERGGLHHDAFILVDRAGLPKDRAARCVLFEALDAGFEAYKTGLELVLDRSPSETNAWAWRCAYPTPYEAVVAALEAREGLPRGTMHAILRQESAFKVDVVSFAGAVGIAQLMPQTAQTTAAQIGMTLDPTDIAALKAPYLQLDLAARHLRALFVELAGPEASPERKAETMPLVVAAYNAGAGAVKRWMREAGDLDADVFIERTPFLETRGYVARVLGNLARYAILAGTPTPTLPYKLPKPP